MTEPALGSLEGAPEGATERATLGVTERATLGEGATEGVTGVGITNFFFGAAGLYFTPVYSFFLFFVGILFLILFAVCFKVWNIFSRRV